MSIFHISTSKRARYLGQLWTNLQHAKKRILSLLASVNSQKEPPQAAENWKERLKHDPDWISLEEKHPHLFTWVLGRTAGGGVFIIRKSGCRSQKGYLRTDWVIPYYVEDKAVFTDWMPLPKFYHCR